MDVIENHKSANGAVVTGCRSHQCRCKWWRHDTDKICYSTLWSDSQIITKCWRTAELSGDVSWWVPNLQHICGRSLFRRPLWRELRVECVCNRDAEQKCILLRRKERKLQDVLENIAKKHRIKIEQMFYLPLFVITFYKQIKCASFSIRVSVRGNTN
jgi:hypothetical protein